MNNASKVLIGAAGVAGIYYLAKKKGALGELGELTAQQPYTQVEGSIQRIVSSLSAAVYNAQTLTGTPSKYIIAIAAYEIGFRPFNFINPPVKATGVMQITPPTLFDVFYFADKMGLVKPELRAFLQKKMTATDYRKFTSLAALRQSNDQLAFRYLKDAEFNVVIGALLIRVLMEWFQEGATINLARLVVGYNRGVEWARKNLIAKAGISAEALQKQVSDKAKKYIANQLGKNGYMQYVEEAGM